MRNKGIGKNLSHSTRTVQVTFTSVSHALPLSGCYPGVSESAKLSVHKCQAPCLVFCLLLLLYVIGHLKSNAAESCVLFQICQCLIHLSYN